MKGRLSPPFFIFRKRTMAEQMNMGKALVVMGLALVVVGFLFMNSDKIPYLGRLPGDLRIERRQFTFYFPLATCLLLSLLLSLILWFISKIK